ncbi:hypothetical protein KKB55_12485, partial [Myxococcota bacterium]|nr:hypothetical protein [Myxococcota bacterium]
MGLRAARALMGLALLSALGCGGPRYQPRPTLTEAAPPPREGGHRATLIILDGLRADALDRYLDALSAADYEPDWPSGLALLKAEGFHFARSQRVELSAPSGGISAAATLITGAFVDEHQLYGEVFEHRASEGPPDLIDLRRAAGAARLQYGPSFTVVGPHEVLLAQRLGAPTLYSRLSATHALTVIAHPLAAGARWYIPEDPETATTTYLPHAVASAAAPIYDRSTREAAMAQLSAGPPPDLLTLYFRQIFVESARQTRAVCEDRPADLLALQARLLTEIDAHLWRALSRYQRAHPDDFERMSFLLVSQGGVLNLGASARRLTEADLLEALAPAPPPASAPASAPA